MNNNLLKQIISALFIALISTGITVNAQDENPESKYEFTILKQAKTTPVISQASTSTCWCFGTTSMLESEIIRLGGKEIDLSEMYTVRNVYEAKADKYVRLHGATSFPPGGAQHDVTSSIKCNGIVPQDSYTGLQYGEPAHKHGELHSVLNGMMENIIKNRNGKLTPVWKDAFSGVLDAYLGENPETFTYEGKEYTPKSFAESLPINPDDYVEFTSYTHHPFYE